MTKDIENTNKNKKKNPKFLGFPRVPCGALWSAVLCCAVIRTGPLHPDPTHNERHRALFAWAAMATSLIPLLPAAQALKQADPWPKI